jgi:hypothetical protein
LIQTVDAILERSRFPLASSYLDRLPKGLETYPECEVTSDAFNYLRRTHPELARLDGIPAVVKAAFTPQSSGQWKSEVVANVLYLIVRDTTFETDKAFLDWAFESSADVFKTPWARLLMHVLSPTLMVMGATKRWKAFHRGSELRSDPAKTQDRRIVLKGHLTFPKHLFPEIILRRYGRSFDAAVATAGGRNSRSDLESVSDTHATFAISWDV